MYDRYQYCYVSVNYPFVRFYQILTEFQIHSYLSFQKKADYYINNWWKIRTSSFGIHLTELTTNTDRSHWHAEVI